VLGIIVLGVLGMLFVRAWSIQVLAGETYVKMSEDNRIREVSVEAARGSILDREGRELVTNRASMVVQIDPNAIPEDELQDLFLRLSGVLQMPVAEIEERAMSDRVHRLKSRTLKIDVSMEVVSYISEHVADFPGVRVEALPVRDYPFGEQAAHILGYTGEVSDEQLGSVGYEDYLFGDIVGKTGVEAEYESVLRGERGFVRHEVDARGEPKKVVAEREPITGHDIVLTIDMDIQKITEEALADAMREAHAHEYPKAQAGAAVVLDVRTGEVIAMASLPTYDPQSFIGGISVSNWEALTDEDSEYPLNNRAVMSAYPPASTFKAVTSLAGLAEGITSQAHSYYCTGKWVEMGEQWPKFCWKRTGHGSIGFLEGLQESCDTVFYEIGYEFYKRHDEKLQEYARAFGLGSEMGIDLPGEVSGRVPDAAWKKWFNEYYPEYQLWLPGDSVNMAIGQGDLLVSPLQLASVYATVANRGEVVRPHLLKEVLGVDGEPTLIVEPEIISNVEASDAVWDTLHQGLVRVTEYGTAEGAFAGFPVTVAGKTGTAEMSGKDDYAWFAAYAPAEDPLYALAIVVEQGGHGGSVAAPAARRIFAGLLGLPVEQVHATDLSR